MLFSPLNNENNHESVPMSEFIIGDQTFFKCPIDDQNILIIVRASELFYCVA